MTDNETQAEARAREVLARQYVVDGGAASNAEYLKSEDSPVIRVDTVIRAMLAFAKEATPLASVERCADILRQGHRAASKSPPGFRIRILSEAINEALEALPVPSAPQGAE